MCGEYCLKKILDSLCTVALEASWYEDSACFDRSDRGGG